MGTVVGKLKGLGVADLLMRAGVVQEGMTGNANFPDAGTLVAEMVAARDALVEAMVAAADGGRQAHLVQRQAKARLKERMTQVLNHVLSVAPGDVLRLITSGFPERRPPALIGLLPAPGNLRAAFGNPGEARLRWEPVHGARLYRVFVNMREANGEDVWLELGSEPHAHGVVRGLEPLKYYWFRVQAVGTAGNGAMSDPARTLVI